MAEKPQVRYRINMATAAFMVVLAGIADILQIFLTFTGFFAIASDLVTFFAEASLGIWFLMLRVNYFSGKKSLSNIITLFATTVVELVPVIDALPTLTIATIIIIRNSRAEDRQKAA